MEINSVRRRATKGVRATSVHHRRQLSTREACNRLISVLQKCTAAQFAAVRAIVELGAPPPIIKDRRLSWPANVPAERRELLVALLSAVYEYEKRIDLPITRAGMWEFVAARLVMEQDWKAIQRITAELRLQPLSRRELAGNAAPTRRSIGRLTKKRESRKPK